MLFFYNALHYLVLLFFWPLLAIFAYLHPKYRGRIPARFGFGLEKILPEKKAQTVIWIHALSVGEVNSALPLLRVLRQGLPDACIVFSVSTKSGAELAGERVQGLVDDFWPNWIREMQQHKVKMMLVNGRISDASFRAYRRFSPFFQPMFNSFTRLCMQTEEDAAKLRQLGVEGAALSVPGNLKFDSSGGMAQEQHLQRRELGLKNNGAIWIAGSTHEGEEKSILKVHVRLREIFPELQLILVPRDIGRARAVIDEAGQQGIRLALRTRREAAQDGVLLLDTLGELARCYPLAEAAFIGGSLVLEGGHNPLEAAVWGVPTLFGRSMDDFREIARDLLQVRAARSIASEEELFLNLRSLLKDQPERARMSHAALDLVAANQGVAERYFALVAAQLS